MGVRRVVFTSVLGINDVVVAYLVVPIGVVARAVVNSVCPVTVVVYVGTCVVRGVEGTAVDTTVREVDAVGVFSVALGAVVIVGVHSVTIFGVVVKVV